MPKRLITLATSALLIGGLFVGAPAPAWAASSDGFTYTVYAGNATVTGCDGACPDVLSIPATLGSYPVVAIGYRAFDDIGTTTLTIPNSVASIGASAFEYAALVSLTIPNSVTTIDHHAFYSNTRLASLTLSSTLLSIGASAFEYAALVSLTIPNSVTAIGNYAFYENDLISVNFLGNAPTPGGSSVFAGNVGLAQVHRIYGATGWGETWGGKPVAYDIPDDERAAATVKPTVSGTARTRFTLTADEGVWTGFPTPTFTYQWYVCRRAISVARSTVPTTCTKIRNATTDTLKLTSAQRQKWVAVLVTGTSARTAATAWLSVTTARVR